LISNKKKLPVPEMEWAAFLVGDSIDQGISVDGLTGFY
jgi:hypothetical protein